MKRFKLVCRLLAIICSCVSAFGQDASVDENGLLQFQQQKISANMRELEDRMMRLAAAIRNDNPDDSARLLLGIENARDKLILEQMNGISQLLSELQIKDAATEQKHVLEKLSQLRRVLVDSQIGVDVKIDQLRNLNDARNRLNNLIVRETEQQQDTADAKNQTTESAIWLAERELQQLKLSQSLHQNLIRLAAPEEASAGIQQVNEALKSARKAIQSKEWLTAADAQRLAIENMRSVDLQLKETQQQLQTIAESAARQRVIELLSLAIDLQNGIRNATVDVQKKPQDAGYRLLEPLAAEQQKVIVEIDACIEISIVAEFSFVLPDALRDVRKQMENVRDMFQMPIDGQLLVSLQDRILLDLEALLGAIQQASKQGSPRIKNNKLNCCSDRNEILAELKMLQWMQGRVNRKTKQLRNNPIESANRSQIGDQAYEILAQQNTIIDVTEKVRLISQNGFVHEGTEE